MIPALTIEKSSILVSNSIQAPYAQNYYSTHAYNNTLVQTKITAFLVSLGMFLQGNAAFKGRQWNKAVNYYTEAIKLNATNATFYCNRAAAYLELGWYFLV